ncbi:MAG: hydantoinase B/oxoprolinase family protein [Pseudomonadota bacterium]|nr:hydantoinase B/oxoprolinase family protein [Pseudomonadota bacterium]
MTTPNAIELSLFASRVESICDEMGGTLKRAAFSPNIRERLDYSCALFDPQGELVAQAAHIPVHLGSMAFSMHQVVAARRWNPGDVLMFNDPFLGGTHLPDVTLVTPVFLDVQARPRLIGFAVNRAHHANIGASTPGSMPVSRRLEEEGLVLPPTLLASAGGLESAALARLAPLRRSALGDAQGLNHPVLGDFAAQVSANRVGAERLTALVQELGAGEYAVRVRALIDYAERLARAAIAALPAGEYCADDCMDDDGQGSEGVVLRVCLRVSKAREVIVDFSGTAAQVPGNINCPLAVTAAAVYYVFRCLMAPQAPACAGLFRPIRIKANPGSLVHAQAPAAVAAGNVETSSRIVDLVLAALAQGLPDRIPAASQGTMNNVAMGGRETGNEWDYYETIAGGMGAHAAGPGLDAVQTHMTNSLNTPIESLEQLFPLRVVAYGRRTGSGGVGRHRGGDGVVREFECLEPMEVTLLTERRASAPWGLAGGGAALPGANWLNGAPLPAKCHLQLRRGDRLRIETPGGGGWGTWVEPVDSAP